MAPAAARRPEALARFDALLAAALRDDAAGPEARTPMDRRLSPGLSSAGPPMLNPGVSAGSRSSRRATVAILSEMNHDVRIVRLAPAPARPTHARTPEGIHALSGRFAATLRGEQVSFVRHSLGLGFASRCRLATHPQFGGNALTYIRGLERQIRIRLEDPRDVMYWAGKWGLADQELCDAVAAVGSMAADVAAHLGKPLTVSSNFKAQGPLS